MTVTPESTTPTATPTAGKSRALNVTLWVFQVLLAALFALSASGKLAGSQDMVDMFDNIGIGQWFRYFTGAVEVAAAIGLLIPRLAGLAALGLVGVMAGATVTHLFVIGGSPVIPIVLMLISAAIFWLRRDRTAELLRSLRRSN